MALFFADMDPERPIWHLSAMGRTTLRYALLYGLPLAALAVALQWAEYRYFALRMPGEIYIAFLATVFVTLGVWVGMRLTARPAPTVFEPNEKAARALGLTRREREILDHLAKGESNKEIARSLGVSPNTIKTQIASLYVKLEVNGRGKAVEAARSLSLIP
ncbi:MAG: LuxR C-terminal-related transcriptional regulator [Pseudomonadota bacterium]